MMLLSEIQAYIGEIENDSSLSDEKNLDKRIEILDYLGFQLMEQIEALLRKTADSEELFSLKCRAEKLKSTFEAINLAVFRRLRAGIRAGEYTGQAFKNLGAEYIDPNPENSQSPEDPGYDNLDIFINGLSLDKAMPEQTKILEPDMVGYQKTPARIVFELVETANFRQEDVFFDLGSGLGQVAILVNLLTGITVKGIEFEPAFCAYASDCAADLDLSNVTFTNVDARKADYSEGTIFFMYTPFKGGILEEVLEALRKESLGRKIKIITYGPCTAQVALQSWLDFATPGDCNIFKPGFFTSF